jgi:hypothetical protein
MDQRNSNPDPMPQNSPVNNASRATISSDAWFTPARFAWVLGLLIACTFPKLIFGLHTFIYRDFGVLAYPTIFHHHESFWRGELPLWNPLSNCGAPFLAQWGTMVLYPFSLFYLFLPLPWSANFFCLAHLFWGGLGMYFLAAKWADNRFVASLAGMAFVFNGVTFSSLMWPNYLVALGWMPWVVLSVERAWREGGRHLIWASIVATLQMLSGVPEIALLTWLLLAAIWIGILFEKTIGPRLLVGRGGAIVALVTCLMAAQLWPFLDLLAHSQRSLGFGTSKWAMPAWGWANFIVPLFRCFLTPQGVFIPHGQEFMSSTYPGITVVLLAVFGVLFVRRRRVWLLAGLALFSLMMAMGENGFLFGWLRQVLPLMGFARYPIKFVVLAAFLLPLLAAYAMRAVQDRADPFMQPVWRQLLTLWLGTLTAIVAIIWFAHRHPLPLDQWPAILASGIWRAIFLTAILALLVTHRRMANPWLQFAGKLGVLLLMAADFLTHSPPQNPTLPSAVLEPGLWKSNNKLPPLAHGQGRVMISRRAEQYLLMSGVPNLSSDLLGKRLALWSNLHLLEGIPKVNGSSTLQLREQMEIQTLLYASTNIDLPRLADFLAVSQMTAPGQILDWTARETALPLATLGQRPIFADATETLQALTNSAFNPSRVVYLPIEARSSITVTNETKAKILSQRFSPHRIELEIDAAEASLLVVAQSFYHPWRAYVDQTPTTIFRANHAFQAVEIPAGIHQVKLHYEDWKFRIGALVSGMTLLLCVIALIYRTARNVTSSS